MRLSVFALWTGLSLLSFPSYANSNCRNLFQYSFSEIAVKKFGGKQDRWQSFYDEVIEKKLSPDRLQKIVTSLPKVSKTRQVISFLGRNSLQRSLRGALELKREELGEKNSWLELTLSQRRGLLLEVYKDYWWQVPSSHVSLLGQWFKPTHYITSIKESRGNQRPLKYRLDELVISPSETTFIKSLYRLFSKEYTLTSQLLESPKSKQEFIELFSNRLLEYQHLLKNTPRTFLGEKLLRWELAKTEVIIQLLKQSKSTLSSTDLKKIKEKYGINVPLSLALHLGRTLKEGSRAITNLFSQFATGYLITAVFFDLDFARKTIFELPEAWSEGNKILQENTPNDLLSTSEKRLLDMYNAGKITAEEFMLK